MGRQGRGFDRPEAEERARVPESAAVAQVCHLKDVPCVVLRVVSDTPGATDDNMTQYMNFWDAAPGCTFDAVNTLLSNL